MKPITVFTATYNRRDLLSRLYKSLCDQTNTNFVWLIIDDGSIDKTNELVQLWASEEKIEIRYIYKENGGLHTAYNEAIKNIDTELCISIDSDDFMPLDAIEKILEFWDTHKSPKYAGIIGLDYTLANKPIGDRLPEVKSIHFIEKKTHYRGVGDAKLVHRTELLKKHIPMPTFKNEKNFNPSYLFVKVDMDYPLLVLNENLCYVDYQEDGMSNNMFNQYRNSPNSFAELRKLYMSLKGTPLSFKFKNSIHYVSSSVFAEKKGWLRDSPLKLLTLIAIPFGLVLNLYIRYKTS